MEEPENWKTCEDDKEECKKIQLKMYVFNNARRIEPGKGLVWTGTCEWCFLEYTKFSRRNHSSPTNYWLQSRRLLFLPRVICWTLYRTHFFFTSLYLQSSVPTSPLFFSSKHLSYSNINTQYSLELFFLKSHLKRQIIIWLAETELN